MAIVLSIPFNAKHPRKVAKATGAIYNPTTKVWVFENATTENDISPKLRGYIVTGMVDTNKKALVNPDQNFWNDFLKSGE